MSRHPANKVRTPGAPAQPAEDLNDQAEAEAQALEESILSGGDTEVSVPAPKGKAAALSPDLAQLVAAEVARELAKRDAAARRAQTHPVDPAASLPSQHEVDAFSIKAEVLTKEGWVVPHAYPQPAIAKQLSV